MSRVEKTLKVSSKFQLPKVGEKRIRPNTEYISSSDEDEGIPSKKDDKELIIQNTDSLSSPTPQDIVAPVFEFQKSKKKAVSEVYQFFTQIHGVENLWCCKLCQMVMKQDKKHGTSNLWVHIETTHSKDYEKTEKAQGQALKKVKTQSSLDGFVTKPELQQFLMTPEKLENLKRLLLKIIVNDERPLRLFDTPSFKAYVKELNPKYDVPCQKTMTDFRKGVDGVVVSKLKDIIRTIPSYSITTDGWKSNTKIPFQTMEIHYVDFANGASILKTRVVRCQEVDAVHIDHEKLEEEFKMLFQSIGIDKQKIIFAVVDGGGNQKKALKKMGIRTIHCINHVLNLIVQSGQEPLGELFRKPKALVTWFNSSYVNMAMLKKSQQESNDLLKKEYGEDFTNIIYSLVQECETRWNSWYLCINRITLLWPEIKQVLIKKKRTDLMGDSDIAALKLFGDLLKIETIL
jgi:hypothetical protein